MADRLQEKLKSLGTLPWQGGLWVLGGSFLLATLVNAVVAKSLFPKSPLTKGRLDSNSLALPSISASLSPSAVDTILKRNIFNAEGAAEDSEVKPQDFATEDETKAVKTTLSVRLIGTIYGGDPLSGAAIVENTSNKSINTFMVGDVLVQNATIKEVLREKIILDNNGRLEFVEVEKTKLVRSRRSRKKKGTVTPGIAPIANSPPPQKFSEDGFQRDGAKIEMTGEYRKKLLTTDFTKVLQDAKATPNMVDGELRGFQLTRIRSESIYEKSGLQNDDIIEEINGVSLNDTSQAIRLLQSLRNESSIELRINRGGSTMRFELSIQ